MNPVQHSSLPKSTRALGGILLKAHSLLTGDRALAYGDPNDTYDLAGRIFALLREGRNEFEPGSVIPPAVLSLLSMISMKLARYVRKPSEDSAVDLCAYVDALARFDLGEKRE